MKVDQEMAASVRPETQGLRRLCWRLTSIYLIVGVLVMVPLAVLVTRADSHRRDVVLDARMEVRAQAASSLAYFDGGRLVLDDLRRDDIATGSPQLVLLLGRPPARQVFASAEPPLAVGRAELLDTATRAVTREETSRGTAEDTGGRTVRLLAAPLYRDDGTPGGAAVVIADPGPANAAHHRLVIALALTCGGLLLVAASGGHLLAYRSIHPTRSASPRE